MKSRILEALVRMGSCILELLTLKERRKARQQRKQDTSAPVSAAQEISLAAAQGDQERVNELLDEARRNRLHGGKVVSVALAALTLAGSLFLSGCALVQPKTIVLPADRQVVKMELDGIPGWFVPESQFVDMAAAYVAESVRMRLREEALDGEVP